VPASSSPAIWKAKDQIARDSLLRVQRRDARVRGCNLVSGVNDELEEYDMKKMSHRLCIVLLLLTCCAFSPQNEVHRIPNIVLVHGAWVDGSGWKGVYDILIKKG